MNSARNHNASVAASAVEANAPEQLADERARARLDPHHVAVD